MTQTQTQTPQLSLSFLVPDLYKGQLPYFLITELSIPHVGLDATIFVENLTPFCLTPTVPVMQSIEAWQKSGTMVATSPGAAYKMLSFPGPDRRIFYSWDLYWLRGQRRVYEPYRDLYGNEDIEVIARSDSHKRAIENAFNIDVIGVVEDFNMTQMMEVLK
jgi:hypothetical protein